MMAYSFLVARWLGPVPYGVIAANYSIATLTAFVVNWGLDTWLLRQAGQHENQAGLAGQALVLKASLGIAWAVILWLVMPLVRADIYLRPLLGIVILNTLLDSGMNVLYIIFLTSNRIKISSVIFVASRFFRLAAAMILIALKRDQIFDFITARILMDLIFFGIGWAVIRPVINLKNFRFRKEMWRQALPYSGSELLNIVYYQADVNLVTALTGDQKLIGVYSIVINLVYVVVVIIQSIPNIIIPAFTNLYTQKSRRLMQAFGLSLAGFALVGAAFWVGSAVFGRQIIHLTLGSKYELSGDYFVAIAPVFLLRALSLGAAALLVAVEQQKSRLIPQTVSVALKVLLTVLILPVWHVTGIIWVYILSEMVMLVGYFWLIARWYRRVWKQRENSTVEISPGL